MIGATDVSALDDRDYREAQLAAGIVEGRLHLAGLRLGASASGMTFLDSEIHALLGEPLDALLFTCVGVPGVRLGYRRSPGRPHQGPNGHPSSVLAHLKRLRWRRSDSNRRPLLAKQARHVCHCASQVVNVPALLARFPPSG